MRAFRAGKQEIVMDVFACTSTRKEVSVEKRRKEKELRRTAVFGKKTC